jgi:fatty acid-binding protein DegV
MPLVDDISPIGDMTNLDKLVFSGMKKITGTKALNKLTKLNEVRTQNERPMTWFIWNGKNPRETQTREELLNLWLERLTYLA